MLPRFLRTLLAALLLLAAAPAALAQTTPGVGIGTTAPTQTLDVNGSVRVRGLTGPGNRLPVVLPDGTLGINAPVYDTPAGIRLAGAVGTDYGPTSVAVSGTTAYVVNIGSNTLQVFNVTTPSAPVLLGQVATGSQPYGVAVSGTTAYVANTGSNTLQVFNVTTPSAPVLLGQVTTGSQPYGVAVSGTTAYVVNSGSNTLQVFNVATPSAPVLLKSVATGSQPFDVAVSGTTAYVVNYSSSTLQVFDVATPSAPVLLKSVATGNRPYGVAVSGTTACVANYGDNTLQVFDVATPSAPLLLKSLPTDFAPTDVAVGGTTACVVNQIGNTLQVFDVGTIRVVAINPDGSFGSVALGTQFIQNGTAPQANANFNISGNGYVGGRVGVGTATPGQKLEVAGNLSSLAPGTQGLLRLNRPGDFGTKFSNAFDVQVGSYGTTFLSQTQVDFRLNDGATETPDMTALTLRGDGNVGIGTTAPSQTLEVAGQVFSSTGGFRFPDNTVQTTAASPPNLTGDVTSVGAATAYANVVPATKGGAGTVSGILMANGAGVVSAASAADFPTLNQNTTGNAATVTTNANLTGAITSVGNATTYAANVPNNKGGAGTLTGVLKATGGTVAAAVAGTDYAAATGSPAYIQNTTTPQAASNFNISGNGYVGGSVGIGTTTPGQKLDVAGNANVSGNTTVGGNTTVTGNTTVAGNGYVGGSVGIGTTTPGQKLEVAGQVFSNTGGFRFPDNTVQTTAVTAATGTQFVQNQTGPQIGANFNVSGVGTVGNLLTAGSAKINNLTTDGIVTSTGGVLGSSTAASFGTSFVQNQTASAQTANFNVSGAGTVGGLLTAGSATVSGNVGIGTSAPGQKLDVAGNIAASGPLGVVLTGQDRPLITRGYDAFTSGNYSGAGRWGVFMEPSNLTMGVPALGSRQFQWATYNANSTVAATLMTLTQDGNLGIGTTTPGQKLEVNGNALLNSAYDLLLRNTNHGLGYYGTGKAWNGLALDGPALYGFSGGLLGTNQNGTRATALYWNSSRQVGIGTTSPLSALSLSQVTSVNNTPGQTVGELSFVGFNRPLPSASILAQSPGFDDAGYLIFKTSTGSPGAQERMRLTDTGLSINTGEKTSNSATGGVYISGGPSGNASVELRGGTPYVDFTTNLGVDFSSRIIQAGSGLDFHVGASTVPAMTILGNVANGVDRVGIGTTAPIAPLHVSGAGNATVANGLASFFSPGSTSLTGINNAAGTKPTTAYFEGGEVWVSGVVVAGTLNTTSDRRIKHVLGRSDRTADLALLNKLRITDYRYIDQVNNSNQVVKKVIAQEVEEVLPAAVSRSVQALPNVFEKATKISHANGQLTVTMAKPHELPAAGGRMRFYTPTNAALDPEVTVVNAYTVRFACAESHAAGLFIYGKYVDDFRSVDYDALSMLNVSATQELARQVAALQQQNAALQAQAEVAKTAATAAQAQATATLEAIEGRLRQLEMGSGQARR